MSKDEKLYMVVDDSVDEPMSKADQEKVRKLDNDNKLQAELREIEKEIKLKYGY